MPSINLSIGRSKNFVDRFLKWALGVGRHLIIITEVIALSAFIYRFSLDRQLIDLNDQIKGQEKILELSATNEKTYRNFQDRISLTNKLTREGKSTIDVFNQILRITPQDMTINAIAMQKASITFDANIQSITSLSTFLKKIQELPKVKSIILDRIDNRISHSIIEFNLNIVINE